MVGATRNGGVQRLRPRSALCVETQGRDIMARIVQDEVAEAMRLGLYDRPAKRVEKANGAPRRRRTDR